MRLAQSPSAGKLRFQSPSSTSSKLRSPKQWELILKDSSKFRENHKNHGKQHLVDVSTFGELKPALARRKSLELAGRLSVM